MRNVSHGSVSIESGGATYRADYAVFGHVAPLITVRGLGELEGRVRTTQLGDSPPAGPARIMLRDMVEDKATHGQA
jgi:hypothetical protein